MLMFMNAWMMLVLMKCKCQMQSLTLGCYIYGPMIGGSSSRGRWLSLASIIVIVKGSCAFSGGAPKATLVDCTWLVWSLSCVGCAAPYWGFGMWCQLACQPPSEWIATTRTSLSASKWTSIKNHYVHHLIPMWLVFIDIDYCDWLVYSSTRRYNYLALSLYTTAN